MIRRPAGAIGLLAGVWLLAWIGSIVVGPGDLEPGVVLEVIAGHLGGDGTTDRLVDALVWDIRIPRALLATVVGGALAAAGTITQGMFRNPMADPGVLGISSGAAACAVLGFTLGLDRLGLWVTPTLAAVGALVVVAILYGVARPVGGMTTLLLSGIAVAALCSSATTLMLAIGTDQWDLGVKVVRWLMGSFEGRSWSHLGWSLPALALGLGACVWLRLDLDALSLGPETAQSLGIDLRRTRLVSMAAVALLVGMATALTGVIGFVGLVVPHVARLWVGAAHRALLPTSVALGAVTLLGVDACIRMVPDIALPPGAVTSLLGAPFFLWLLRRHDLEGPA